MGSTCHKCKVNTAHQMELSVIPDLSLWLCKRLGGGGGGGTGHHILLNTLINSRAHSCEMIETRGNNPMFRSNYKHS